MHVDTFILQVRSRFLNYMQQLHNGYELRSSTLCFAHFAGQKHSGW